MGVGDVEHTRHAVAVTCLEAAGREVNLLHHVAVDDREALLLSAADEHGAVDLYAVDIDAVLVEGAATDVVLARQLVVCADARLRGHKLFHGVSARARHAFEVLLVQFLHRAHLSSRLGHGDFCHLLTAFVHHDVERQSALRLSEYASARLEAHHVVEHHHAVGRMEREAVLPVETGRRAEGLSLDAHLAEGDGVLIVVRHLSLQEHLGRVGLFFGLRFRHRLHFALRPRIQAPQKGHKE